jgi:hypothetical protein
MDKSIPKAGGQSMADGINILSSDAMIKIIETRLPGGRALTLLLSVTAALAGIGFLGGIALHDLIIPLTVWLHDLIIEIGSRGPTLHFPKIPQLVAWSFASGVVAVVLLYATYYVFGMIDLLRRNMLHDWDHHIHTWQTFERTNGLIERLMDQTSKSIGELTDLTDIVRILSERIERLEASEPSKSSQ